MWRVQQSKHKKDILGCFAAKGDIINENTIISVVPLQDYEACNETHFYGSPIQTTCTDANVIVNIRSEMFIIGSAN